MKSLRGHRAKLYRLSSSDAESWVDQGVGMVRVDYSEIQLESRLVLESETTTESPPLVFLDAPISSSNPCYKRTGSTIITWTSDGAESALSFEDEVGCGDIWEEICSIQGPSGEAQVFVQDDSAPLPEIRRENLPTVAEMLTSTPTRARLVSSLLDDGALGHLLDLFERLEAEKDAEGLIWCFAACKAVALVDNIRVTEALLTDENFERFAGVLEYEPNLPASPNYREFLRDQARFKKVVPIADASVMAMISQRFRLSYLRDVLLPRVLDEAAFKRLGNLDSRLSYDIADRLHKDEEFMHGLLQLVVSETSLREEVTSFLAELSTLAQRLPFHSKTDFYKSLSPSDDGQIGLFDVCERILASPTSTQKERLNVADLVIIALRHDPSWVRCHILKREDETPGHSLMGLLLHRTIEDDDPGVQTTCCETLRAMLDPETSEMQDMGEKFLELFYRQYGSEIGKGLTLVTTETQVSAAHVLCELVTFCVQTHGHLAKDFLDKSGTTTRVLGLLSNKHKHLVLDAIRFVRTCVVCIAPSNEFYASYIVDNNLLGPVHEAFERNGRWHNNLVQSAVLELLDRICKADNVRLIQYAVHVFGDTLRKLPLGQATLENLETLTKKPPNAAEDDDHSNNNNNYIIDEDDEDDDGDLFAARVVSSSQEPEPRISPPPGSVFDETKRVVKKRIFSSSSEASAAASMTSATPTSPQEKRPLVDIGR